MALSQSDRSKTWRATPRGQYSVHKHNAKVRGVEFELTFEQWWAVWQNSRRWDLRGNRHGRYVMCRCGDEGAYALGNVYIALFQRNFADARVKSAIVRRRHTRRTTTVTFMADGRPVPPPTRATQSG